MTKPIGVRQALYSVEPDRDPRIAFCTGEYPRLVRTLTLYTGDRELALDLAQETLARACLHWNRISRLDSPGAWAYRVAINLAKSTSARRGSDQAARARVARLAAVAPEHSPTDAIAVRTALGHLPDRQRTALVLRFYLDLPVRDAARVMRCREGTVKALTHQAVANLRRSLAEPESEVTHVD